MDWLGARLGVAENRDARIALLTKALKKYEETQKSVEHSDAPLSEADVLWWRRFLHAKLSLLGEQNDGADHVKLVQKEWIAALTKVAGHHELSYKVGTIDCEAFVLADVALVHAQFEAAGDREQRITVLTEAVKRETKFLDVAQDRFSRTRSARMMLIVPSRSSWPPRSGCCPTRHSRRPGSSGPAVAKGAGRDIGQGCGRL